MDQLKLFETAVSPAVSALFLNCPETVRLPRLIDRGKQNNGNRQDDDTKTIQKRFVQYLRNDKTIDAQKPPEAVFLEVERALGKLIPLRKR